METTEHGGGGTWQKQKSAPDDGSSESTCTFDSEKTNWFIS